MSESESESDDDLVQQAPIGRARGGLRQRPPIPNFAQPGGNNPQPLPQNPAPQQPPQGVQNQPANTTEGQRKRRWSVWAGQVLGVPSTSGQGAIMSSAVATAARIDEATLQPGQGLHCAGTLQTNQALMADQAFAAFVQQLDLFEKKPLPRGKNDIAAVLAAAQHARTNAQGDQAKIDACDEVIAAKKAMDLSEEIVGFGRPPWAGPDAKRATAAKVELDLLSIPKAQRQLTPLPNTAGVNSSYWVKRTGGNPNSELKSFLLKPATIDDGNGDKVGGIPNGGEVAREAMAGRAVSLLGKAMRLDLDMPETHVVSLSDCYLPGQPQGNDLTCSVQEAKPNKGEFRHASASDRAKVPPAQCAAIAFMDLATLNTDRHGGNIMLGDDNSLIPIDHGCCFPSNNQAGRGRIRDTIGGPHNALLRMPGTHQPMTDDMAAGLRDLDPVQVGLGLQTEQQAMGQDHPSMAGTITDESIAMAMRSMRFMKVAGGIKSGSRRLSPAVVQVAFGANSAELFALPLPNNPSDMKVFDKRATEILKLALTDQPVTEQACLMDDSAYGKMAAKLKALGWRAQQRNEAPQVGLSVDPALCLKLIAGNVSKPNGKQAGSVKDAREALKAAKVKSTPAKLGALLTGIEMEALNEVAALLPTAMRGQAQTNIRRGDATLRANPQTRRALMEQLTATVMTDYDTRWTTLKAQYDIPDNFDNRAVANGIAHRDYTEVGTLLVDFETAAANNVYPLQGGGGGQGNAQGPQGGQPPQPQGGQPPPQQGGQPPQPQGGQPPNQQGGGDNG